MLDFVIFVSSAPSVCRNLLILPLSISLISHN
jgi:hypothetical protein